ncbi:MAG: NAD(P)/FAD-dependent oxidoreductase [Deltaproteobacteria bacterium]|nr:NAD(P)/FAD-dependent oxidoreductase [Deltaproteobacteria bacterium]
MNAKCGMQFVVVGNGIAGISAANTIRKIRPEASVTVVSEEAHPAYSACLLPDYISGDLKREEIFIKKMEDYYRNNIRFVSSRKVIRLDAENKMVITGTEILPYDRLIIATGSKAVIPPVMGVDKKGVFTLKTIEDADKICRWEGRTSVVVGSGPIGIEASMALKRKGYRVYIVEGLKNILPMVFDDYPATIIKDILKKDGIEILTGERVVGILGGARVTGVETEGCKIKCDTVILATGMRPEVGLAGGVLELGELGGIKVDDRMRTGVQDIYACGDCVEAESLISGHSILSLLWHNARLQGEIAGSNAGGVTRAYRGSLNITGLDIRGTQAVSIGRIGNDIKADPGVIEKKRDQHYQRLILSNCVIVGGQSVGSSKHVNAFIAGILRQEKVKSAKDVIRRSRSWVSSPRSFRFGRKVNTTRTV